MQWEHTRNEPPVNNGARLEARARAVCVWRGVVAGGMGGRKGGMGGGSWWFGLSHGLGAMW